MQPVCFTAATADLIAVYCFFELPFGNRKKYLWKGGRSLSIIHIQHPEWKKVECLNLRATFLEEPADDTEIAQTLAFTKCLFQALVEKNV